MKQHYYSFSFVTFEGGQHVYASSYAGYGNAAVSLPRIEQAKRTADVGPNSVLLSCCYLGVMTADEFKALQAR